jgi:hypothetical protein
MRYIEAINKIDDIITEPVLFLAGGITGTPNWQKEIITYLQHRNVCILNPRRENFPIGLPEEAKAQILWEYKSLHRADIISFWFPKETLCPIVLYELGYWVTSDKPIFIGIEKGYQREWDVIIQTSLERNNVKLSYSINSLANDINTHLNTLEQNNAKH